ncbi:hypothetical protein GN156_00185 [bacterium LRH843]|nr:hypothetical protein [bacterium LRH843]
MFQNNRQYPMNRGPYHQPHNPSFHQMPPQPFHQSRQMNPYSNQFQQPMNTPMHPMKPNKPSFIKSAFINDSGKLDIGRTVQTMDQVMKTVNQISPIVKQVSGFFLKK